MEPKSGFHFWVRCSSGFVRGLAGLPGARKLPSAGRLCALPQRGECLSRRGARAFRRDFSRGALSGRSLPGRRLLAGRPPERGLCGKRGPRGRLPAGRRLLGRSFLDGGLPGRFPGGRLPWPRSSQSSCFGGFPSPGLRDGLLRGRLPDRGLRPHGCLSGDRLRAGRLAGSEPFSPGPSLPKPS